MFYAMEHPESKATEALGSWDAHAAGTSQWSETSIYTHLNRTSRTSSADDGGREAWFSVWQARFDEKDQQWTRVTTIDHQVRAVSGTPCCCGGSDNDLKIQMFIGKDGKPVNGCTLDLSLKDFICEEDVRKEEDFEDVPLKITSEELHKFYEDSLQPHICAEIRDEKRFISKDVKEDLAKIVEVERILQKPKKLTSKEQESMRSEELDKARDVLADAQKHIKRPPPLGRYWLEV
ncbi:hypothetical protein F5883DRAFT_582696 [Diaporthe sp. PMI_573]|nr:hypothetical protein F5883DRAFT_582696 [Diaporthaceae sp. PMI_573]